MDNFELQIREASRNGFPIGPCLSQDELEDFYSNNLTAERQQPVRAHLASCNRCLDSARDYCMFMGIRPEPDNVVEVKRRSWTSMPAVRIAAVAVLAAGLGAFWTISQRHDEPAVVRSTQTESTIDVVSPRGPLTSPPSSVEWRAYKNAASYDVELRDVKLNILWKRLQVTETKVEIPAEVAGKMAHGNEYAWRVTAITKEGHRVNSAFTTFSLP